MSRDLALETNSIDEGHRWLCAPAGFQPFLSATRPFAKISTHYWNGPEVVDISRWLMSLGQFTSFALSGCAERLRSAARLFGASTYYPISDGSR